MLIICALCYGATLAAQEPNTPPPEERLPAGTDVALVLAAAEYALDQRQYDEAAERYREALRLASPLPEAEYGLARVLEADGLRGAAERKYLAALAQRDELRTPELAYEIRYRLASLYQNQGNLFEYERQLELITADDVSYGRRALRLNAKRVLYSRGVDRLFQLYRFGSDFALSAHAQLGEHYVRSGNYGQAVDHLIFAFVLHAKQLLAISGAHLTDAHEQGYSELIVAAHRVVPIRNWLDEARSYRLLFYLGAALYGDGPRHERWREVLSLVAQIDGDSPWGIRARQRLASPAPEPLYP